MEGIDVLGGRFIHDDSSDMTAPNIIQFIILDGKDGGHTGEMRKSMAGTQVTDVWYTHVTVETVSGKEICSCSFGNQASGSYFAHLENLS